MSDAASAWDSISKDWGAWKPPLRPAAEDLAAVQKAVSTWRIGRGLTSLDVLILGATRELATIRWPYDVTVLAVDRSPMMVARWGYQSRSVSTVVGDWFNLNAPSTRDLILADGSFVFYDPAQADLLRDSVLSVLREGGLYTGRHFVLPQSPQTPSAVVDDARAGRIRKFGTFKFRMAMALQPSESQGVVQNDVWEAIRDSGVDLRKAGFPDFAIDTLRYYEGSSSKLYFPSRESLQSAFQAKFEHFSLSFPSYEFGDCCPMLSATK